MGGAGQKALNRLAELLERVIDEAKSEERQKCLDDVHEHATCTKCRERIPLGIQRRKRNEKGGG